MGLGCPRHTQTSLTQGKAEGTNCTIAWAGMKILAPLRFERRKAQPVANTTPAASRNTHSPKNFDSRD